jgi:hypothetical protein
MMTRKQAIDFIQSLKSLRGSASDEQALNAKAVYPSWRIDKSYVKGERILYNTIIYRVLQDHTSQEAWTPDITSSLFAKVLIPDDTKIYPWEQPDSTNPYKAGDKVKHKDKIWVSDIDNNVWEPGVYGWSEVNE